ncbi:MAG: homocysteine S-methyltransferase family protein [Anaerolineae bacterium]|nr:homocysteine S-methyltransferase family protein [Anaerolineae bacterium]
MLRKLGDVLQTDELILADGAFGTMLQAQGLPAGTLPEAWNVERPEVVQAVYRAYADAGAQYVTANTFGGNRPRLADAGLAEQADELNRLGIALAKDAVGDRVWVGASIGPTGQLVEPYGTLSVAELEAIYADQIRVVAEAGADIILIETQHQVEEACAAVSAAKAETALPVFCTFSFNVKGRTMMGLRAEDAARRAEEAGADVVGANCGDGPPAILAALEQMRTATDLPLLAKPNAGIPQAGEGGQALWDVTPEEMVAHARAFVALGARVIGGCCGTTPAFIAAIRAALRD